MHGMLFEIQALSTIFYESLASFCLKKNLSLRDLAHREKSTDFSAKFSALKQRHFAKSSFIQRLQNVSN